MQFSILLLIPTLTAAAASDSEPQISFKDQVAPILVRNCLGCHNDQKAANGLNMRTFALLKKGGKSAGDGIIEPGDPDSSEIVTTLRPDASTRMPYKLPPLGDDEIRTLERWVKEGAKFDGGSESEVTIASLVDPLRNLPKVEVRVPVSDPVTSLAFTPDDAIVAAGVGRDVLLFDAKDGKSTGALRGHPGPVTKVLISRDGKTLIAAGGRPAMFGSVVLWDLKSRTRTREVRSHSDAILSAALSPDGGTLATASYDRLIKLWDLASGGEARSLKEHTDAVMSVAFSADGQSLASASADRTVKIWDVKTGKKRMTLSDATGELYAVVFDPSGKTVLAGGVDRSIRVWDVTGPEGVLVKSVSAHDSAVIRLVLSADGKTLYSSGEDKDVKIWDYPGLKPRNSLAEQPDWPMALAVNGDGSQLAVGRYDGSIALIDPTTGKQRLALRDAPEATSPPKPELVRDASLNPPSPRGAVRGSKRRVTLTGTGVGQAREVVFKEPGITATIVPADKPDPNRLDLDLRIDPDARVGLHRVFVRTPLGVPGAQSFAVSADAEFDENEPNDRPAEASAAPFPATFLGTIDKPGNVDHFRFRAQGGKKLVLETVAKSLGSSLSCELSLLDESGRVVAEANERSPDPILSYTPEKDAELTLRVSDAQFGGSGNHFYRINAGTPNYATWTFPLGVSIGQTRPLSGSDLGEGRETAGSLRGEGASPGAVIPVRFESAGRFVKPPHAVVAEGVQSEEKEGNDSPATANPLQGPGGISGTIGKSGDLDYFRFDAKKGERWIVEVFGGRLGTAIDSRIEILDHDGNPIPRAVLRPVEETFVAFRDHPSTGRSIRLTQWNDFAVGDYVLMGRELLRLFELPRNPDDDAVFWGLGNPRNNGGERLAFLETTPEHHPLGQSIYKVEIHPPGATFPSGGLPAATLYYRNDDGGPGLSKDSRLTFDAPADGGYLVRLEDAQGRGGERLGYHLVVRRPSPDFQLTLSNENPNVPRGGTTIVTANITRIDGFDGPVDVKVEGLPPGVSATTARIEPESFTADLLLSADETAPAFSPPTWMAVATATTLASPGAPSASLRHELDPGGPTAGWVTVTQAPDLTLVGSPTTVEIKPGERVEVKLSVHRNPGFSGRVPIDVRNLPRGVQVLHIGLNGVLVTESQTERTVFLYAEPWAEPQERPFYAVGRLEVLGKPTPGFGAPVLASSREHSSSPIQLIVRPSKTAGPQASVAPNAQEPLPAAAPSPTSKAFEVQDSP